MSIILQAHTPNEDRVPKAPKKTKLVFVMVCGQVLIWQFFDVPKAILKGWKNFLFFNLNYFSVPVLLKTFFSHWRRYHYPYGRVFEGWRNIETFVFNTMSRIIGAILRSVFIALGFLAEIFIILGGIFIFLGWLILPFLLIFSLIFGFSLIFI